MKLSVIIPAYNEEDRIIHTINETLSYLNRQNYKSEVIVVSDGSTDRTKAVVEERFAPLEKVALKAIEYHPNRGKGYAVAFGMLKGSGDAVMFMDADYSVPITFAETGLDLLEKGYDIAIASRVLVESVISHHQNIFREYSAKIYTWIQNHYLGIGYGDTQCGFKLFTRAAAHDLFSRQKLASVIFDPEILWLAQKRGYRVGEFPVNWTHVENSRIQYDSLRKSVFVFKELFRIKSLHRKESDRIVS
jgi:dolichyl-phosphate beta-glucosyltransferase